MPEGRAFPYKYLPRRGVALGVTFGAPIRVDALKSAIIPAAHGTRAYAHDGLANAHELTLGEPMQEITSLATARGGWMGDTLAKLDFDATFAKWTDLHVKAALSRIAAIGGDLRQARELPPYMAPKEADEVAATLARETARIRSAVTAVLHHEVEALGRRVLARTSAS